MVLWFERGLFGSKWLSVGLFFDIWGGCGFFVLSQVSHVKLSIFYGRVFLIHWVLPWIYLVEAFWWVRCKDEIKSDSHCLFEFDESKKFWSPSPFWYLLCLFKYLDFSCSLQLDFNKLTIADSELFVISLWVL